MAIKRSEILVQAKTQMNLENNMLSERNHSQRPHIVFPSIKCPQQANLYERKTDEWLYMAGRVGRKRGLLMDTGFFLK